MSYVSSQQDPFRAIADPSRRQMLDAMFECEQTVTQLTALLGISQPAVSQHLQVLKLAGLIDERREGRTNFCRTRPSELRQVVDWLGKYEAFWKIKLDGLERHLARQSSAGDDHA
jgi:DNA-binding transcriptional ArsR family regulator